jgi:hypothetical protein
MRIGRRNTPPYCTPHAYPTTAVLKRSRRPTPCPRCRSTPRVWALALVPWSQAGSGHSRSPPPIPSPRSSVRQQTRGMSGANGSRECAPDDKLRDTHQLLFMGRWVSQRAQPIELLHGFGGSLGANAALPDASPPPELWVASSSQSCRIPYSSSGVLFSSGAAIPRRIPPIHSRRSTQYTALSPCGPYSIIDRPIQSLLSERTAKSGCFSPCRRARAS